MTHRRPRSPHLFFPLASLSAIAFGFLIVLIAFGRPVPSAAAAASPTFDPPKDAPARDVRLGYFPNISHAQALLGVGSGDFAKALAPNKLVTRTFNAGPSLIESLFAGEIDIGRSKFHPLQDRFPLVIFRCTHDPFAEDLQPGRRRVGTLHVSQDIERPQDFTWTQLALEVDRLARQLR